MEIELVYDKVQTAYGEFDRQYWEMHGEEIIRKAEELKRFNEQKEQKVKKYCPYRPNKANSFCHSDCAIFKAECGIIGNGEVNTDGYCFINQAYKCTPDCMMNNNGFCTLAQKTK